MWQLRVMRIKRKMSLRDLADVIGATPNQISSWERGTSTPRLKTALQLAEYFGCTVEELMEDTDERVS